MPWNHNHLFTICLGCSGPLDNARTIPDFILFFKYQNLHTQKNFVSKEVKIIICVLIILIFEGCNKYILNKYCITYPSNFQYSILGEHKL